MLVRLCAGLLLANLVASAQDVRPSVRPVEHYEVTGASRLAALAKLGSLTNTTFLVEIDRLHSFKVPVHLRIDNTTVDGVMRQLLPAEYIVRERGSLLIVSPRAGARNRVLTLPLAQFRMHPEGISSVEPYLAFTVRRATGCKPQGYGWAGPPMQLAIPDISFTHATLEKIVGRVADAPEASMWIVTRESSITGCINDPASKWQVGLYGFGRASTGCQTPFRESVGPSFIAASLNQKLFADDCLVRSLGSL